MREPARSAGRLGNRRRSRTTTTSSQPIEIAGPSPWSGPASHAGRKCGRACATATDGAEAVPIASSAIAATSPASARLPTPRRDPVWGSRRSAGAVRHSHRTGRLVETERPRVGGRALVATGNHSAHGRACVPVGGVRSLERSGQVAGAAAAPRAPCVFRINFLRFAVSTSRVQLPGSFRSLAPVGGDRRRTSLCASAANQANDPARPLARDAC